MADNSLPFSDDGRSEVAERDWIVAASDGAALPIRFMSGQCWLGSILVAATGQGICAILLGDDPARLQGDLEDCFPRAPLIGGGETIGRLTARVIDFVEGDRQDLDLPLDPRGSDFQRRVWQALREIPRGSTASYSEIAKRIGVPKEAYAVGEACGANMIAVAIPCHRVVHKDGAIGGYRWGFKRKRALLKREAAS